MLHSFIAFQKSREFYKKCKTVRIAPFLQLQLLRASSSVALNLAEGSGKPTPGDQKRFYGIALGSPRECEAILELEEINRPDMAELAKELGAILFRLTNGPRAKPKEEPNSLQT